MEVRVRLANGELDEAVLSADNLAGILDQHPTAEQGIRPVDAEKLRLLVESARIRLAEFSFSADRKQLYSAWNALANLADLTGTVTVKISATAENEIDQNKLENGVLEPLRESKLIE